MAPSKKRKQEQEMQRRAEAPPPAKVAAGEERKGTGAFDAVDGDLLTRIMLCLPAPDRYCAAIRVCKAWRRLRSARGLFTSILVGDVSNPSSWRASMVKPPSAPTYRGDKLRLGPWEEHWCYRAVPLTLRSPLGLLRLVQWHERRDEVDTLAFTTFTVDRGQCAEVIDAKAVEMSLQLLPRLRTLLVNGRGFTAKAMRARPPFLAGLRTLAVGEHCSGSPDAFGTFLSAAPKLERLCAPFKLCNAESLGAAVQKWREAGDPSLKHLYLYGDVNQHVFVNQLGTWLPNLETLAFNGGYYEWQTPPTLQLSAFPRLRELRVEGLATPGFVWPTTKLEELTAAIFEATSVLETLQILHGATYTMPLPLTRAGTAFRTLPETLKVLALADITLAADSLFVHSLDVLRLDYCGHRDGYAHEFWPDLDIEDFRGQKVEDRRSKVYFLP